MGLLTPRSLAVILVCLKSTFAAFPTPQQGVILPHVRRRLEGAIPAVFILMALACVLPGCEFGMENSVAECSVSVESLDFGTLSVGASADLSFVIRNMGSQALTGSVSENSIDYSVVAGAGDFSLAADQTLLVRVRFTPTSAGVLTCDVDLGTERCSHVSCTGVGGTGPICEVNPTHLDFEEVSLGSSLSRSFTIRNVGDGTLTGSVSLDRSDYSIIEGEGSFGLGPGHFRNVGIRFEPTSLGLQTVEVLTGTACGSVSCEGTGLPGPACELSTDKLNFGDVPVGGYADRTFDIENVGGGTLSGSIDSSPGNFLVIDGEGEFNLLSGVSRTVTVRFAPLTDGYMEASIFTNLDECSHVACTGTGTVR
jgi:hypothetical protein